MNYNATIKHKGINVPSRTELRQPSLDKVGERNNIFNLNHAFMKIGRIQLNIPSSYSQKSLKPTVSMRVPKQRMNFGNYTFKRYEVIAPRSDKKMSLYEKLVLKNYASHASLPSVKLQEENKNNELEYIKTSRVTTPVTTRPNISYYLLSRKNAYSVVDHYLVPTIPSLEDRVANKSQQQRYKKITSEFGMLKLKMMSEPEKIRLLAMAVCFLITNSLLTNTLHPLI